MAIIQLPTPLAAQSGLIPATKKMVTTDSLATITTAGYLNAINLEAFPLSPNDLLEVLYSYNQQTNSGTFGVFIPSISNGVITLVEWINPGDVLLPVLANHIAMFNGTSGQIYDGSATAIHGGSIQAGLATGTAGTFISYSASSSRGSLILAAVANTGNTNTTISNAAMGQASVISIPDPANAVARFLVAATATPFTSGNIPVASGTGGLMVDSGKSAAALSTFTSPTVANHIAVFTNTSGNLGEDAATAINLGNIQAGDDTTKGQLLAYGGSTNGHIIINPIGNTGNTAITIQNAIYGQATVLTIPDPATATADFVIAPAGLVSGNFVQASGTAGLVIDSGIVASGLQILSASVSLNQAAVQGMYAAPVQIVAAQANKVIIPVQATVYTNFQTAAFANGGSVILQYDNTVHGAGTNALMATIPSGEITVGASQIYSGVGVTGSALTGITNKGLFFSNDTGAFTGGNAASTVVVTVSYYLVTATV